jgi:hypothetical protein
MLLSRRKRPMNHRWGKKWAVVLVTGLVFVVSLATVAVAEAPHALPFLRTGVGARAAGKGNAFEADDSDASAGYFKPAGLTRIESWG